MKFISYAKHLEDVMLWRIFHAVEHGFFIDVGAADPHAGSVSQAFYQRGWRGVNVEYNLRYFEKLTECRERDINLHAKISTTEDILGSSVSGTCLLLDSVFDAYAPGQVQWLRMNTANAIAVIQELNTSKHRPQVILINSNDARSLSSLDAWKSLLDSKSYRWVWSDGFNHFYLGNEYSASQMAFLYPPNEHDDFVRYVEWQQQEIIFRLESRLSSFKSDVTKASFEDYQQTLQLLEHFQANEEKDAWLPTVNKALYLLCQQQIRLGNLFDETVRLQTEKAGQDAERLREQDFLNRQHDFKLEQQQQQFTHAQQVLTKRFELQLRELTEEKQKILQELQGVYHGRVWRMTKPVRFLADYFKPIGRKVYEGGRAWVMLTPESRPRRTARRLKRGLLIVLRYVISLIKHNPRLFAWFQAKFERYPQVRLRLKRWLHPQPMVQQCRGDKVDGYLGVRSAAVYRRLQSIRQGDRV